MKLFLRSLIFFLITSARAAPTISHLREEENGRKVHILAQELELAAATREKRERGGKGKDVIQCAFFEAPQSCLG